MDFITYHISLLCMFAAFHIFIPLVIFCSISKSSFYVPYHTANCHSSLPLAMVPCHLPYFSETLTIKNACYLPQFPVVHVYRFYIEYIVIPQVIFGLLFTFYFFYFTFHILLPLAIVPCHLPYFIGTLTIKNG